MDLLINYGTNASSGGQPVIAEIQLNIANTVTYSFSFFDGTYFAFATGNVTSDGNLHRTNKIPIIGNSIILDVVSKVSVVSFWNENTYLGLYAHPGSSVASDPNAIGTIPSNGIITPPANATHFGFFGHKNNAVYGFTQSYATFVTLQATSTDPSSATTTFYDSYPDGNVIGTTAGTEVAGDQQGPTLIVSTGRRSFPAGSLDSDQNWRSSQIIDLPVGATSVNFDSASKYTLIRFDVGGDFYNPTTAPSNAGTMLSNGLTAPVPSGATKIIMLAYTLSSFNYTAVSESSFGSLVLSFVALGYLQIDPPQGKKIKQIALKGL